MLARPAGGCPVYGSMMCAPRSATPEVATAKSRPVTTRASRPGCSGSAIPIRHSPLAGALHVAAAVDAVLGRSRRGQDGGGPLDGPPLHVAGGVEGAARRGGEVPAAPRADGGARLEHLGEFGRAVRQRQRAAAEPADIAVVPVRREGGIHPVQPAHRPGQGSVAAGLAGPGGHVERDDRAHHVLGVPAPRRDRPAGHRVRCSCPARSAATGCSPRWCSWRRTPRRSWRPAPPASRRSAWGRRTRRSARRAAYWSAGRARPP